MKIAHIVESMEVGGAEIIVCTLCRLHRRAGAEVSVHCLVRKGSLGCQLEEEGVPVYLHGRQGKLQLARSLYRGFRASAPDVVHCHNAFATTWGAPAARLAGVKAIVSTRHGLVSPPHPWKREVPFWLAARCCARVVAVCDATGRNLAIGPGAIPTKLLTIRNCAAPAHPGEGPTQICKSGLTLITVARLAPPKDHAGLLHAVALASPQAPDLHLWIVGNGVNAPALHGLASELGIEKRVEFLGERHDVAEWLAAADLFVLSSYSEGVPISLLEALAAGLPVIVTDVGGMPEIARLSGAGTIVPTGDPQALADAILRHAASRDKLAALGARARSSYEQYFHPERMAMDYLRLYQQCLTTR